jgi:predicted alpha/beta-hydrolase family hydrolase
MTSQAQAETPLTGVRGLAFLGFPLHPVKKPAATRAEHLFRITVQMLFLQGDRDQLAELSLLHQLLDALGPRATLSLFPDANHSFHVPVRSGRTDEHVMDSMLDILATWITKAVTPAE